MMIDQYIHELKQEIKDLEEIRGKDHYCYADGNCDGLCLDIYGLKQLVNKYSDGATND